MADIVSKLKTAALVAGTALFVVACGEKAAETTTEVTTEEAAPAVEEAAPAADEATMEAAPAEGDAMATEEAPAEAAAEAPAAE